MHRQLLGLSQSLRSSWAAQKNNIHTFTHPAHVPAMQLENLVPCAVSTLRMSSGVASPRHTCAAAVKADRLPCSVQATASVDPAGI